MESNNNNPTILGQVNGQQFGTIEELAAELHAIFQTSYDGIYVTDANGKTLRVNSAYQRVTGIPLEKLIGRNIKDIVEEGLISESITFKILQEGKALTIKQTVSNGKEILVTGSPIFNDKGEISRVVTNVRDMSELRELEKKLEHTLELKAHFEREISQLKKKYEGRSDIIAQSQSMSNVIELAERLAKVDTTVLILGESGVGKELVAQLIHKDSPRAKEGTFIKVNCGAIPAELLESELFGYEEGAFSGARKGGKAGLFEIADKGTIFLDEIADLPLNLQVKLLRVLQEGELTRLGGTKPVTIDVRLVSATNKDLAKMVKDKLFREDLYYRLNEVPLVSPPLRERKEDIFPITASYLRHFNAKYKTDKILAPEVIDTFYQYEWPGNIRELVNTLERLVVTVAQDVIRVDHLPLQFLSKPQDELKKSQSLPAMVAELQETLILNALKEQRSTRKAARVLGISQSALMKKIKKYGIVYEESWGSSRI